MTTTTTRPHPLRATLRRSWERYAALHDRRRLLDRPWLEDVLHWSGDGELHGQIPPSVAEGPRSVTADGWCPGLRRPARGDDAAGSAAGISGATRGSWS